MKTFVGLLILVSALFPCTAGADFAYDWVLPVSAGGGAAVAEDPGADYPTRGAGATATYSMKVAISMPAGTAGAKPTVLQPSNTKFSPCVTGKVDAATFTLTYNAGSPADKDVYLLIFEPAADGVTTPKFCAMKKGTLTTPVGFIPRLTASAIVAATDIYLEMADNPGGTITETFLGGSILLDGVRTGTWQIIGIVADSTTVNFNDPTTWTAWDSATIMVGMPWTGTGAFAACQ